ncbi:MAG: hypothetical protein GY714_10540 [Desulfobacterales bacterium]|nr:hypothetical protein [Desulfobacterales bacterium]
MKGYLIRFKTSDQGTFGKMYIPKVGFECFTAELPFRDNKKCFSCIPEGNYKVVYYESKRRGPCYQVTKVPNRTSILFHSGNFAGDVDKNFLTHSKGCVLPGKYMGSLSKQSAVLCSRYTMSDLVKALNKRSFKLKIINDIGGFEC